MLLSFKEARQKRRDRTLGKGFKKQAGNVTADIKPFTRCRFCNKKGHWKAECPEKEKTNKPIGAS